MDPGFEYLDHTADIAVRIKAPTIEGLFRTSAMAMMDSLVADIKFGKVETKRINLNEYSPEELLVSFLNELNFLFSARKWLLQSITSLSIEEYENIWQLKTKCLGSNEAVFTHKAEIKAATFHRMEIKFENGNYTTVVVFDI